MQNYRKKPVVIQAVQYTGDPSVCSAIVQPEDGTAPYIETLEGKLNVSLNDWIIRGVKGEHYPCKPDVFERTYDALE